MVINGKLVSTKGRIADMTSWTKKMESVELLMKGNLTIKEVWCFSKIKETKNKMEGFKECKQDVTVVAREEPETGRVEPELGRQQAAKKRKVVD